MLGQLKKQQPNADYDHLTLVGHSNGGDISMYFAKQHPDLVSKVVTLDNLRVPFVLSDKIEDPVVPLQGPEFQDRSRCAADAQQAAREDGIDIIKTRAQHTEMSDRGPDSVKEKIQATLDHFLTEAVRASCRRTTRTNRLFPMPRPTRARLLRRRRPSFPIHLVEIDRVPSRGVALIEPGPTSKLAIQRWSPAMTAKAP